MADAGQVGGDADTIRLARDSGGEVVILITVALTTMLAPLNSTMIGVALPDIMGEFATDLAAGSWLVIAYLVTMASLQPVGGKLGDRFGRRPLILIGLLYFAVASLGAATAESLTQLLVFRVQQGIAGAIALPNGMALVREVVPPERRASRIGLLGSAIVLAAAAGPPLGGVLIRLAGWRAVFSMNLFLIVLALILAWRVIPTRAGEPSRRSFDVVGVVQLIVILAGGAALLTGGTGKLPPSATWGGAVLLVLLAVYFLYREAGHEDPVFQPRFFLRRTFASGCAGVACSNLSMYTTFLTIPLLLAGLPGWSSTQVGLVLSALWAPTVVCAPLGGRLADRWGRRWPTTLGMLLLTVGMAYLVRFEPGTEALPVMLTGLIVAGIGLGLSQAGLQTAVLESVTRERAGSASGIYSTCRYAGSIAGSSALPMLYGVGDEIAGFTRVLTVVVITAFAATLATLGIQHRPSPH